MLSVKVNSVRKVYVSFCDDTHPNKGGYFCQVYEDENMEKEIDNFVIHANELRGLTGTEKLHAAYKIANRLVKQMIY